MGIYDRDYYRNEGPSFLGSYVGTGRMCMWLVAINVVIVLIQLVTYEPGGREAIILTEDGPEIVSGPPGYGPFTEAFAMKPREAIQGFQIWRFVTGMFVHNVGDFIPWHIFWNMLFLWIFGRDLEDLYGRYEFLAFYILAGTLGNVLGGGVALWSGGAREALLGVGVSSAVMAVTVLCALHYPHRTIFLMFVLPLPYWAYALMLVVLDLYSILRGTHLGAGVAAHLGGAGFAVLYWHLQWRILHVGRTFFTKARRSPRPRLRIVREDEPVVAANVPPARAIDPSLASRADAILEKISRHGKESLTDEERDILQRASEEYRKRKK